MIFITNKIYDDEKNINTLIEQLYSTKLPPLLGHMFNYPYKLIKKMYEDKICIYRKNESGIINVVKPNDRHKNDDNIKNIKKPLNVPKYLFGNKGSESIKYFSFKNDGSLRPMGIVNPMWYFSFIYNILISFDKKNWLNELYNSNDFKNIIHHSNSPIIGYDGQIASNGYDSYLFDDDYNYSSYYETNQYFINENTSKTAKFFQNNQEKMVLEEATNPYYLKSDVESYFQNIYTHKLENLKDCFPYNEAGKFNTELKNDFFIFLDEFNMSVNDNHTKGIIQGPLSSSISAELLGIYIDYQIISKQNEENKSDNIKSKIPFIRYVDDMTFFATDESKLENQKEKLFRIFRRQGLTQKSEKVKIAKGFAPDKSADMNDIYNKLTFLNNPYVKYFRNILFDIRRYLKFNLSEDNIVQVRATLTKLKGFFKNISNNEIINKNAKLIYIFLYSFILKMIYTNPNINSHGYKLIDMIIQSINNKEIKIYMLRMLLNDTKYIEKHYAETEIQIWHYYLIGKNCCKSTDLKEYDDIKDINDRAISFLEKRIKNDPQSADVLLLLSFVNDDKLSLTQNIKIFDLVKDLYKTENKTDNISGIGSSKWWPIIVELYIYLNNNSSMNNDKEFNYLKKSIYFVIETKKHNIKYEEMGIFKDLI